MSQTSTLPKQTTQKAGGNQPQQPLDSVDGQDAEGAGESNYTGKQYREFPKNKLKVTLLKAELEDVQIARKGKYGMYAIVKIGINQVIKKRPRKQVQKSSPKDPQVEDNKEENKQPQPDQPKLDDVFETQEQLEKQTKGWNRPQYTKIDIQNGRNPEWNQTFEFERTTEQKIDIIFKERAIEPEIANRIYYSWNKKQQPTDLDVTIGISSINFSKALRFPNEKIEKQGIITTTDCKQELGQVFLEFDYDPEPQQKQDNNENIDDQKEGSKKKKFFEINEKERNKLYILTINGCKADGIYSPEEYKSMQTYLKIRTTSSLNQKTGYSPPNKSLSWNDSFKFDIFADDKKIFFEIHFFDEKTKFDEVTGFGQLKISQIQEQFDQQNEGGGGGGGGQGGKAGGKKAGDFKVELTYMGKKAGFLNLQVDQADVPGNEALKRRKQQNSSFSVLDQIKNAISPSSQKERQKNIEILEKRKKFFEQKLYENVKVEEKDSLDSSQLKRYKDIYELKIPANGDNFPRCYKLPEEKEGGLKNVSQLQESQIIGENNSLVLPKIEQKEPVGTATIKVKRKWENIYQSSIFGQGFSKNESSSSLQGSVHSYSIPKGKRFDDFKSVPPGPGRYLSIGFLPKTENIDDILKNRRKMMYEDFVKGRPE